MGLPKDLSLICGMRRLLTEEEQQDRRGHGQAEGLGSHLMPK
jgi:hypothetical protein